jgi:transglutaminase-like putative cysteine protease
MKRLVCLVMTILSLPVMVRAADQAQAPRYEITMDVDIFNKGGPGCIDVELPYMEPSQNQRAELKRQPQSNYEVAAGERINLSLNYEVKLETTSASEYPAADPPGLVTDPDITKAVNMIISHDRISPKEKALRLLKFVNEWMTYDDSEESAPNAREALATRRGVCEDYALLYAALCRASGLPARMVYGLRIDNMKDIVPLHAWVEVNIGTGWQAVETVGNNTLGLAANATYIFWSRTRPEIKIKWQGSNGFAPQFNIETTWRVSKTS